jgi:hypothetical protein
MGGVTVERDGECGDPALVSDSPAGRSWREEDGAPDLRAIGSSKFP